MGFVQQFISNFLINQIHAYYFPLLKDGKTAIYSILYLEFYLVLQGKYVETTTPITQENPPQRKFGTAQKAPAGAVETEGPTEAEGDQLLESFNNLSPLVRIKKTTFVLKEFDGKYKN